MFALTGCSGRGRYHLAAVFGGDGGARGSGDVRDDRVSIGVRDGNEPRFVARVPELYHEQRDEKEAPSREATADAKRRAGFVCIGPPSPSVSASFVSASIRCRAAAVTGAGATQVKLKRAVSIS